MNPCSIHLFFIAEQAQPFIKIGHFAAGFVVLFRFFRGWRGGRIALLSVLGFGAVLFTYLGVNYLPSLHSYL